MTTTTSPLADAVGRTSDPFLSAWDSDDSLLYALGVGAGSGDLAYTTENSEGVPQRALPTMAVVVGQRAKVFGLLGRLDWTKIVHAEQSVELRRPVPVAGEVETVGRIAGVYDKGKHAAIAIEFASRLVGEETTGFVTVMTLLLRGAGGWGGDPGTSSAWAAPEREPDHIVCDQVRPEQALLYRLSGDRNRLHSDPLFARRAGFERPILHGLCTYGFAGRALVETVCDGDPDHLARMHGRFSAPTFPGETLQTRVWSDERGALFETVKADGSPVISHGRLSTREGNR